MHFRHWPSAWVLLQEHFNTLFASLYRGPLNFSFVDPCTQTNKGAPNFYVAVAPLNKRIFNKFRIVYNQYMLYLSSWQLQRRWRWRDTVCRQPLLECTMIGFLHLYLKSIQYYPIMCKLSCAILLTQWSYVTVTSRCNWVLQWIQSENNVLPTFIAVVRNLCSPGQRTIHG